MGKDLKGKELGKGISQRKDGRYVGRFTNRFGNRPEVKSYSLVEVRERLAKMEAEDKLKLNVFDENITLDVWYEKWMSVYKYGVLKENSKCGYINHYKKHIKPYFGKDRLIDITKLRILDRINEMDRAGYGYEMKNRTRIMLLDMFDKAMQDELVSKNPAKGIKIERDEEKEPRVLSEEEQSIFFDCCKGTFYDNLFVVAVNTGMRPGEVTALEEKDLDFEKKQISVTKTLIYQKWEDDEGKTFHIDTPKTKGSRRIIPISKKVEIVLKKQILQKKVIANRYNVKETEFTNLLFTTRYNTPICDQTYIDAIEKIIGEINLMRDVLNEFERFTPHAFRHTFATRCIEAGMKPKVLQNLLGHATLQMTMDLYAHVLPDMKGREMELFNAEMERIEIMSDDIAEKEYDNHYISSKKVVEYPA